MTEVAAPKAAEIDEENENIKVIEGSFDGNFMQ